MRCRRVRGRMSAFRDGELPRAQAAAVDAHLAACPQCRDRFERLSAALEALADAPRLECPGGIAPRVLARLEVESRGPGLALLFRPSWAARPLIVPSLVPAALMLAAVLGMALARGRPPIAATELAASAGAWDSSAPWGSEGNPVFPSSEVSVPRHRHGTATATAQLAEMAEGTLFLETVVARDGTVSTVTVIDGDRAQAAPLLEALRHETFEPVRFRGRPVAVSLYRLISRLDVRPPLT